MVNKRLIAMVENMKSKEAPTEKRENISIPETNVECFSGFNDIARAIHIRNAIIEKIGFNGALIRNSQNKMKGENPWAHSNAAFATLSYLAGYEKEAKEIRENIIKKIGYTKKSLFSETNLIRECATNDQTHSISNSYFGILNYLLGDKKSALATRNDLIERIGFNKDGLVRDFPDEDNPFAYSSAAFASLEYLLGNENNAIELMNKVNEIKGPQVINNSLTGTSFGGLVFAITYSLLGYEGEAKKIADLYLEYNEQPN